MLSTIKASGGPDVRAKLISIIIILRWMVHGTSSWKNLMKWNCRVGKGFYTQPQPHKVIHLQPLKALEAADGGSVKF